MTLYNSSESQIENVTFTLSRDTPTLSGSVQVYSEDRELPFARQARSFTDNFAPYEAHVYILKHDQFNRSP